LKADHDTNRYQLAKDIKDAIADPELATKFARPDPSSDRLYKSHVIHVDGMTCSEACDKDVTNLVKRPLRSEDGDNPVVHYGLIASANQVMKNAEVRDILITEKNVLCFEMEAAGLMNDLHCLVIRGICGKHLDHS
jgi:nucleoside phosphorylase